METFSISYILDAIEELETYIPLLENQEGYNKVIVGHSVNALRQSFEQYKQNHYHYDT